MSLLRGVAAVVRFQLERTFTWTRIVWWVILVLFPPMVVGLTILAARAGNAPRDVLQQIQMQEIFVLVPNVACMLGVFLWTSTVLQSEIENRSWIYLAVRPWARTAHIIGSYLVAVLWTVSATLLSLLLCLLEVDIPHEGYWGFVSTQIALIVLSSLSFAALYLLIGVLFYRNAMVIAVVYTLGVEFFLGALPTTIAQFTMQYRLRTIWFIQMGWTEGKPPGMDAPVQLFGKPPLWHHGAWILVLSVLCVAAASILVSRREIPIQEEAAFQ